MISIVTPVLNGKKFILKNIESIQKLNIPYEHIVIDGGSVDGTVEYIRKNYPDVIVVLQKNQCGMYAAIHEGFELAKYDYISWINCDDQIIAKNFQESVIYANKNKYDLLYGDGDVLYLKSNRYNNCKSNPLGRFFLKKGILPFNQPSSIFSKSCYYRNVLDYEKFKIAGDLDMFMRMAFDENCKIYYFRKPLSVFVKHGNSLGDHNEKQAIYETSILLGIKRTLFDKYLFRLTRYL